MQHRVIQFSDQRSPIARFLGRVIIVTVALVVLALGLAFTVFVVLPLALVAAALVLCNLAYRKVTGVFRSNENGESNTGRRNVRVINADTPDDL